MERQRHFIDFTLSSLWRRKGKNGALLLVYSFIVFLSGSVLFFTSSLRQEAAEILRESPEMIVQRLTAGRHDLIPTAYADRLKTIRGVSAATPRLWGYYYHPAAGANYTVMAPQGFVHGDDRAAAGAGVLRSWGTSTGGELYFRSHDGEAVVLEVAESLDAASELITADLVLVSENTFRRLFGIPPDRATDIALDIRNAKECAVIAEKIASDFPDTRTLLREEIVRTYEAVFDWRSGYVVVLLSGAVLAFFIFAWDRATGLSSEERTEIGILKAVGWETSDILTMKFWEGAVISLTAFLTGISLAYVHVHFARAPLFQHALMGWSTLYPDFKLHPAVGPYPIAVLFFLTVVPYSFLTIVPVWKAAVTDPDAVIKSG